MKNILRIGTDFSGIDAPIQALKKLGIEYEYIFGSEIDRFARKSILANGGPKHLYIDAKCEINHNIDLYVAGFPCQSFSTAGKLSGNSDLYKVVIDRIIKCKPKCFIIENVANLKNFEQFNILINELSNYYVVSYKVLNTRDYGIPQNRKRIYIIGSNRIFDFPEKIECDKLINYVDFNDTSKQVYNGNPKAISLINKSNAIFLNLGFQNFKENSYVNFCPCLTSCGTYYNRLMCRKMNINEMLALQGFSDFNQVCSYSQLKKQIGNSMSVNILELLIKELIHHLHKIS